MSQTADAVHCDACGADEYPYIALNERGTLAPSCPVCNAEHRNMKASDLTQNTPSVEAKVLPIRKASKTIPAPPPEVVQPTSTLPPTDILSQVRERIQYLDLEIAKAAGYAAERKQLARMLMAAEKTK